jgi:hypothetical protein
VKNGKKKTACKICKTSVQGLPHTPTQTVTLILKPE